MKWRRQTQSASRANANIFANTQADLRPPVVTVVAGVVELSVAETEQTHVVITEVLYELKYSQFQSLCHNLQTAVCLRPPCIAG